MYAKVVVKVGIGSVVLSWPIVARSIAVIAGCADGEESEAGESATNTENPIDVALCCRRAAFLCASADASKLATSRKGPCLQHTLSTIGTMKVEERDQLLPPRFFVHPFFQLRRLRLASPMLMATSFLLEFPTCIVQPCSPTTPPSWPPPAPPSTTSCTTSRAPPPAVSAAPSLTAPHPRRRCEDPRPARPRQGGCLLC